MKCFDFSSFPATTLDIKPLYSSSENGSPSESKNPKNAWSLESKLNKVWLSTIPESLTRQTQLLALGKRIESNMKKTNTRLNKARKLTSIFFRFALYKATTPK